MYRLLLSFCLLIILCSCNKEENPPLNVLLIMVDDLGSADLGFMDSKDIQTPHLDQLAKEGMVFSQAYSGNTVCAPARSTLMTGFHAGHTQVRGNTGGIALPSAAKTMAELFKEAGYATGGYGKWGLGEIGTEGVPEKQGFDEFFGYYHQIHAHNYYPDYLYRNSEKVPQEARENEAASYSQNQIFEAMKSFITANKDQAFFCYAPWPVPHGQYVIPDADPAVALYKDEDWSEKRKNYAAMVSLLDRQVGETLELLKTLEIAEHTLVIFCSDNGGDIEFAEYKTNGDLRGFKRDLYEGGIRVPMIARLPGQIKAASEFPFPIYFPDLLPTLITAINAPQLIPQNLDGKSMWRAMRNVPEEMPNRFLYWEYPHYDWGKKEYADDQFKQALRYNNWKMIRVGKDNPWELYDLNQDPGETDNIEAYHPGKMGKFKEWIAKNRTEMIPQTEPERIDGKPYR